MSLYLEPSPFTHGPPPDYEIIAVDEERLRVLFDQMDKDRKCFQAHSEEWRKKYPDMTVVVYKEELVAVGRTKEELDNQLNERRVPFNVVFSHSFLPKPTDTTRRAKSKITRLW